MSDTALSPIYNKDWEVGVSFDNTKIKDFINKWNFGVVELYKIKDEELERLRYGNYLWLEEDNYNILLSGIGFNESRNSFVFKEDIFYLEDLSIDKDYEKFYEFLKDLSNLITEKFYIIIYPKADVLLNSLIKELIYQDNKHFYLVSGYRGNIEIKKYRLKILLEGTV